MGLAFSNPIIRLLSNYDNYDYQTGQFQKALDLYNNNGVKCYCFTIDNYTYTTYDVLTILKTPSSQISSLSERLITLWGVNYVREPFTKLNTAIEIAYKNRSNNFCFTMPALPLISANDQVTVCGNDLILLNKRYRNKPI